MLPWATSDLSAPSCSSSKGRKQEVPWHRDLVQGERRGRGPYVSHKEKQTGRCLCSSGRGAGHLACTVPAPLGSQSRHGHRKGNTGFQVMAPPLAEGPPNTLLGLPGPWSLDPSSGDTHFVPHHVIMRSHVLTEAELSCHTWNYSKSSDNDNF